MPHIDAAVEPAGLRERKKQRTRRTIAEAALRLFAERGYEETTIADIAAAADVSPRTFFSYFPSKEDVVFAEMDERLAEVRSRIAECPTGETPLQTMRRIVIDLMHAMAAQGGDYGAVPIRLVLDRPSLQARALTRIQDAEQEVVARLQELCPELDEVSSVVIAGATVGGLRATIQHCRAQGYDIEQTRVAVGQALAIVEEGLASVPALNVPR